MEINKEQIENSIVRTVADNSLPFADRFEAQARATAYGDEQANILAPLDVNRKVAQSIITEMENCLHIGNERAWSMAPWILGYGPT